MPADVIQRVRALRRDGHFDDALLMLGEALKSSPDDPALLYETACTYDPQGKELDAIPFYERAIAAGLAFEDLRGALLGLGSSYRCAGRFEDAVRVLREGAGKFSDGEEFKVFLAMALGSLGRHDEAQRLLLKHISAYSNHAVIETYRRAIAYYAEHPSPPYD